MVMKERKKRKGCEIIKYMDWRWKKKQIYWFGKIMSESLEDSERRKGIKIEIHYNSFYMLFYLIITLSQPFVPQVVFLS